MEPGFWHDRWERGQLGFHQQAVNELLEAHWPSLEVPPDAPVFVPLCGKSHDMHWLRKRGHPVIGIELSPIAVRDFFEEAEIPSQPGDTREAPDDLVSRTGSGYSLYCGDFFSLDAGDLNGVRGCYDRAALIALPPELRGRYADHLAAILPFEASILLITLEYDQTKMAGPPHSVPPLEVEGLFGEKFSIESLASSGPMPPTAHFQERGLDVWNEHVLRLTRKRAS